MKTPKIFCISLARDAERRSRMTARLESLGAEYEIVDAVDGKELDLSELGTRLRQDIFRKKKAQNLSPAEVGCYLSHYNLWERIAAENMPAAIVAEDDAIFTADFLRVVSAAADMPREWDVIHLSPKPHKWRNAVVEKIGGEYRVCRMSGRIVLTVGYLISAAGVKKLLPQLREINDVIDYAMSAYWNTGIKFYAVCPRIVEYVDEPSNISFDAKARKKGRKFWERVRSKIWRLSQSVKCRIYNFRNPV